VSGAGLTGTARTTGLLYLGLAVTGVLGFMLVRGQIYVADDPRGTLSNLVEHTSMARLGIVLELGIVLTRALAAVSFYRLFRSVDTFAAGLVAAFGMVNAVAILVSAAVLATGLDVADDRSLAVSGGAAAKESAPASMQARTNSGPSQGLRDEHDEHHQDTNERKPQTRDPTLNDG
jgi:hypothetical protein